ncbi:MAG: energy-coupled thiamine transporter ThiT [Eubacteriales bacterium]
MNNNTQRLTVSGIMIALGTVLSFVKVFELPYGGSITLFSMVPVLLLGFMFGIRWGVLCGAVFGALQALLGATMSAAFAGQTTVGVVGVLFIDYILAFSVLGLAGIFKNRIKNSTLAFALGCFAAIFLRFAAHFTSGVIIWGSYATETLQSVDNSLSTAILNDFSGTALAAVYSIVYNASYMVPEMILSVFAAVILMNLKPIRRLALENTNKM